MCIIANNCNFIMKIKTKETAPISWKRLTGYLKVITSYKDINNCNWEKKWIETGFELIKIIVRTWLNQNMNMQVKHNSCHIYHSITLSILPCDGYAREWEDDIIFIFTNYSNYLVTKLDYHTRQSIPLKNM